jgi:hypothetical protein
MLTHWASFEDCRRLAQVDDRVHPAFRDLIQAQREFARLGTLTVGGKFWMEPLLKAARERASGGVPDARDVRRIAFVLGGLVHQACDRAMKPILTGVTGADWSGVHAFSQGRTDVPPQDDETVRTTQEVSAYFDAEVFREVYAGGAEEPFSNSFMKEFGPDAARFEEFIRSSYQRALLASHTIKPDYHDVEGWLDKLFDALQPLYLKVDVWVRAYTDPDPAKIDAYRVRSSFYRADDPTIQAARALQRNEALEPSLRAAVLEEGRFTSAYGEILQTGLSYLRSASDYWRGAASELVAPNYDSPWSLKEQQVYAVHG